MLVGQKNPREHKITIKVTHMFLGDSSSIIFPRSYKISVMLGSLCRTLFLVIFNGVALLLCFHVALKQKLQISIANSVYK
jgi:hypothetical protein